MEARPLVVVVKWADSHKAVQSAADAASATAELGRNVRIDYRWA